MNDFENDYEEDISLVPCYRVNKGNDRMQGMFRGLKDYVFDSKGIKSSTKGSIQIWRPAARKEEQQAKWRSPS